MNKEELATERNEVREILEDFSEELSQSNRDKLSRVFCIINGDEKRIVELEALNDKLQNCWNCKKSFNKSCSFGKKCEDVCYVVTNYNKQLTKAKEIIKELYEGLDKLYLSGLSAKQIAFIEQLQDKAEQFLKDSEVEK